MLLVTFSNISIEALTDLFVHMNYRMNEIIQAMECTLLKPDYEEGSHLTLGRTSVSTFVRALNNYASTPTNDKLEVCNIIGLENGFGWLVQRAHTLKQSTLIASCYSL